VRGRGERQAREREARQRGRRKAKEVVTLMPHSCAFRPFVKEQREQREQHQSEYRESTATENTTMRASREREWQCVDGLKSRGRVV